MPLAGLPYPLLVVMDPRSTFIVFRSMFELHSLLWKQRRSSVFLLDGDGIIGSLRAVDVCVLEVPKIAGVLFLYNALALSWFD